MFRNYCQLECMYWEPRYLLSIQLLFIYILTANFNQKTVSHPLSRAKCTSKFYSDVVYLVMKDQTTIDMTSSVTFFYRFLGLNICIYVIVNGTTNTFPTTTQSKNSLTLWVRVIIFGLLNDYKWIFLPKINSFVIYLK